MQLRTKRTNIYTLIHTYQVRILSHINIYFVWETMLAIHLFCQKYRVFLHQLNSDFPLQLRMRKTLLLCNYKYLKLMLNNDQWELCNFVYQIIAWLVGCTIKANCLLMGPGSTGGNALRGGLSKGSLPVFTRVSEKNHEKLRTARSTNATGNNCMETMQHDHSLVKIRKLYLLVMIVFQVYLGNCVTQ